MSKVDWNRLSPWAQNALTDWFEENGEHEEEDELTREDFAAEAEAWVWGAEPEDVVARVLDWEGIIGHSSNIIKLVLTAFGKED